MEVDPTIVDTLIQALYTNDLHRLSFVQLLPNIPLEIIKTVIRLDHVTVWAAIYDKIDYRQYIDLIWYNDSVGIMKWTMRNTNDPAVFTELIERHLDDIREHLLMLNAVLVGVNIPAHFKHRLLTYFRESDVVSALVILIGHQYPDQLAQEF
jgi:hypothetical protein